MKGRKDGRRRSVFHVQTYGGEGGQFKFVSFSLLMGRAGISLPATPGEQDVTKQSLPVS
jgi:hypothetical protein